MRIVDRPQIGTSLTADFEENTWTFQLPERYAVSAGIFAIVPGSLYKEMLAVLTTASHENMSDDLTEVLAEYKDSNQDPSTSLSKAQS